MKRTFFLAGLLLSLVCLAGWGCHAPGAANLVTHKPFTVVQLCDPQFGFDDYAAELGRFRDAVQQINSYRPDLVVVCGDLVNIPSPPTYCDFNLAKAGFAAPCYCAPGNHDLGNTATATSLGLYRQCIGKDYDTFDYQGYVFVVVNSQLWKAPVAGESERQDAWLKRTLETAARNHRPVFIVSHYVPFEKDPDEPEAYFNLPVAKRKELLALFERCGVVAILAGHTHKTIVQEYKGMQIVVSETTSRNFDNRPFGFRIWQVGASRPFTHTFVPLSPVSSR